MTALFKFLNCCHTEEEQDLFSVIPECRTWSYGLNLPGARFRVNIRKNSLTAKAVQQCMQEYNQSRYVLIVFMH